MKRYTKINPFLMTAIFLFFANVVSMQAQEQVEPLESFKAGDLIYYGYGNEWTQTYIKSISLPYIMTRASSGSQQTIKVGSTRIIQSPKLHEAYMTEREHLRAFANESQTFNESMRLLSRVYDPEMIWASSNTYAPPSDESEWPKIIADLTAIDRLCKKYGPFAETKVRPHEFASYFPGWCALAANPAATKTKAKQVRAEFDLRTRTQNRIYDMENAMRNNFESVLDDYQMMVFEPEAYKQKIAAELQAEYAKRGAQLPTDFFDKYAEIAPKMKTLIEQSIQSRTWTMPTVKDAALEGLIRGQYAKSPAVSKATIQKVGFVANTWASVDDMNWISTTGNVSLYRIEKNKHRFRRGYVLVKMPNRPECQAREFVLRQDRAGGGFGATKVEDLGSGGIFIKCP